MDSERWNRISALFRQASEFDGDVREQFLIEACADDAEMLQELRSMLAADDDGGLDVEQIVGSAAAESARTVLLQQRIGNYQLVELLGSGGMGNVYLGQRIDKQFEHEVAIKVLQAGSTDAHFVERFRAERQLLASLDHPNIAKLLDGGVTEDGMHFLVMEYVRGESIDRYCDERRLNVQQRLRLFQELCLAVDYAHRNLVVHRDVKPSNILVTDEGVPKLLDFGIAKVMDSPGTLQALTLDSQRMMTPEYASPEQVRGEPVSTATDVYSLGVLLYRLLCGRGPYNVRSDLPSSLARAILEDLPSKPSTVLTTPGGSDDSENNRDQISNQRQSTVTRLRRRLQGDLDNIALMALRKEPERRYSSALALHQDIENYLSDRPVSARSDSIGYLASKFVRRHRAGVAVTAAFFLVLVFSVLQIIEQRDRAESASIQSKQVTSYLSALFSNASPEQTHGADVTVRDMLDQGASDISELREQPLVQARLLHIMANSYSWIGDHARAAELFQETLAIWSRHPPNDLEHRATVLRDFATAKRILRDFSGAEVLFEESLDAYRKLYGDKHTDIAGLYSSFGDMLRMQVRLHEAREMLQLAIAMKVDLGEDGDSTAIDIRGNLALVLQDSGHLAEAEKMQRRVVADSRRIDGDRHPNTIVRIGNLAGIQAALGKYDVALTTHTEAFEYIESELIERLNTRQWAARNRARFLYSLGRFAEAEALYEKGIELSRESSGEASIMYASALLSSAASYVERYEFDSAVPLVERAMAAGAAAGANPGRDVGRGLLQLARIKNLKSEYVAAEALARQAIDHAEYIGRMSTLSARRELAVSLGGQEKTEEADELFVAVFSELSEIDPVHNVSMLTYLLDATNHYLRVSNYSAALMHGEQAYRISLGIRPNNAWPAAIAVGAYGRALYASGSKAAAAPLIRQAFADLQKVFGDDDPRVQELALLK